MPSRKGAMIFGVAMVAGVIGFAAAGASTGAGEVNTPQPAGIAADNNQLTLFKVDRRHQSYPLRDEQEFDRGVWCAYKKVKVYDKYHDESYFIDKKVCLGTIVE